MSNLTHYKVERGEVQSDCMPETHNFISQNLKYLYESLIPVREEIAKSGSFSFICYEDNWSFTAKIDKVELARVSSASGVIQEGHECSYDELLSEIQ